MPQLPNVRALFLFVAPTKTHHAHCTADSEGLLVIVCMATSSRLSVASLSPSSFAVAIYAQGYAISILFVKCVASRITNHS